MSTTALAYDRRRTAWWVRAADYAALAKPKVTLMVLLTVAAGAALGGWRLPEPVLLVHTLLGTALVAASACGWNQILERATDARMPRTAGRPLPSGRLGTGEVAVVSTAAGAAGVMYLAAAGGPWSAGFAAATWIIYVLAYTPLKSRTTANTAVGAVAGALPVLIGWTAAGGSLSIAAATLFVIVYLWQFPHFMAIAWIYREQYSAAGLRMLTVADDDGAAAGGQTVAAALALLPVSMLPTVFGLAGPMYLAWATVLGLLYLAASILFRVRRSETHARVLLKTSLVYLPAMLIALVAVPVYLVGSR